MSRDYLQQPKGFCEATKAILEEGKLTAIVSRVSSIIDEFNIQLELTEKKLRIVLFPEKERPDCPQNVAPPRGPRIESEFSDIMASKLDALTNLVSRIEHLRSRLDV